MEVDSVEFTLELGTDILKCKVLINSNEAPVADMYCLAGLTQDELWLRRFEQQADQIEAERSHMVIWPIPNTTFCDSGAISL